MFALTFDATATRKTPDGGLCDALDVVAQNLAVTLGAAFAESLATLGAVVSGLPLATSGVERRGAYLSACVCGPVR